MTDFHVVTAAELAPVLDELNGLEWPVPFNEVPAIFERLGWEQNRRKGGLTTLPVSLRLVSVGMLGDEVSGIRFRVSDTLPDTDAASRRRVAEAMPAAVRMVSECLGQEPTGAPWATSGSVWDLVDGRQIRLIQGEDVILFQYWSKRMADIERHERDHGVDPYDNLADRE